jgi:hypothetical protein
LAGACRNRRNLAIVLRGSEGHRWREQRDNRSTFGRGGVPKGASDCNRFATAAARHNNALTVSVGGAEACCRDSSWVAMACAFRARWLQSLLIDKGHSRAKGNASHTFGAFLHHARKALMSEENRLCGRGTAPEFRNRGISPHHCGCIGPQV